MEQCSGCRFWLNWDSETTNLGECHRYPPRMATVHRIDAEGAFTTTIRPDDGGGGGPLLGGALGRLLLFLGLLLLGDDLQDAHLRQAEGAAAVRPALLVLQHLDALAARQHVAGAGQRVLAAEALINGHGG